MPLEYEAPLEVVTREPTVASILWLHGLGANGYDFLPIVQELSTATLPALRFVFPHAPDQAVSLNGGYVMPSWYDIIALHAAAQEDEVGIRESIRYLNTLIGREIQRGIAPRNIILAGFSQGGNIALNCALRYPQRLGGALILSSYLGIKNYLAAEAHPNNRGLPIFMAHGTQDDIVPRPLAEDSRNALQTLGYAVAWRTYPMPHTVCAAEINDIGIWLQETLTAA